MLLLIMYVIGRLTVRFNAVKH